MVTPTQVPFLPRGVRRHFDAVRDRHVLLGPERALMLDETGQAILAELDGERSVQQIAADLAERYNAPVEAIAADMTEFLSELADKQMVWLRDS